MYGGNDDVVIDSSITNLGPMQDWNPTEKMATARLPITAIITDAKGEKLTLTITRTNWCNNRARQTSRFPSKISS